jgi:hypothetical protein
MSSHRRHVSIALLALAFGLATLTAAGPAARPNPARPSGVARGSAPHSTQGAITAVVVKSWGNCSSGSLIWDDLNANWSNYGSIPISIDYNHAGLCATSDDVTLAELEATGADVVILDDPAGNNAQYTAGDVSALKSYALEGHNVIGTYLTFVWGSTDNRALAPLFGLKAGVAYTGGDLSIVPSYSERFPALPLFRDVGNPYVSSGYPYSQRPVDNVWSPNELTTGQLIARNADGSAAIVVRKGPPFYGIFIANMPEYQGSTVDEQWFYNAIIFPSTG